MENQTLKTNASTSSLSRRSLLAGFAVALAAPTVLSAAPGPATRRFWMTSIHTREQIDTIYFRNGNYDPKAIRAIRYFMRDWRTNDVFDMEISAIDLWSDLHRELGTNHPFQLISGYRSPKTNAGLRAKSSGVAKKSYHMRGMAADLRLSDRNLNQIAEAASRIGAGGIGLYPKSDFIHIDSGRARRWQG